MTVVRRRVGGTWQILSGSASTGTVIPPGAPMNVGAAAGNGLATVSWTTPLSGTSPITGYVVTSSPGGITAVAGAAATSVAVTGLTNETIYTFTVHATSAVGNGPESSPSNAVTPSASSVSGPLAWAPPTLTSPTDVYITNSNSNLLLDPSKDYILHMPATPLDVSGGLLIKGGNNIVLIGGSINLSQWYGDQITTPYNNRALLIQGAKAAKSYPYPNTNSRTVHIEGLLIDGNLYEGVDVDLTGDTNVTIQFQNCRINGALVGSYSGHHADGVQWWNGPRYMRFDRMTIADTHYQGLFCQPAAFGSDTAWDVDIRHSDIYGNNADAGYLIWNTSQPVMTCNDVYVKPYATRSYPSQVLWGITTSGITNGYRPGSDACPLGTAGIGYTSPGYL